MRVSKKAKYPLVESGAKYFLDTLKKYSIDGWYEE